MPKHPKKMRPPVKRRRRLPRGSWKAVAWAVGGIVAALVALPYLVYRPAAFPAGFRVRSAACAAAPGSLRLLVDDTAWDPVAGKRVIRQEIFDTILGLVRGANSFVYLDFFLWNGWQGEVREEHRKLSRELADALLARKREKPYLDVLCFVDPVNRIYGAQEEPFYGELAAAGIPIVFTDIGRLPDSNRLYGPPAAVYGRRLARLPGVRAWLARPRFRNPFQQGGAPISALQGARLLRFSANHRKVAIADSADGTLRLVVASFNPADGSSAHSNLGILARGPVAAEALKTELQCVAWSAENPADVLSSSPDAWTQTVARIRARLPEAPPEPAPADGPRVEWLTEGEIRDRALAMLELASAGDQVRLAMFYLSDRGLIVSLKAAAAAGADVRVILDYNRDAFGRLKTGVPNRPAAAELMAFAREEGVKLEVRWAETHGEQYHPKALGIANPRTGKGELLCGSANGTRRNLRDLNLEADLACAQAPDLAAAFAAYFDRAWTNGDGLSRTVSYDALAETGLRLALKTMRYRFQEATGLSSF